MNKKLMTKDNVHRLYTEKGLSIAAVARELETTTVTLRRYMKKFEIEINPHYSYVSTDLTGRIFGRLTVERRSGLNDRHGKSRWICKCSCGDSVVVNASSLLRGLTNSCNCLKRDLLHGRQEFISRSYWRRVQHQAAQRGIEFLISPDDVLSILDSQGGKCALSGLPIAFYPDYNKPQKCTASIDRIDSCRGYTRENIQVVHKSINMSKAIFSQEEFIAICNLVAENHRREYETCVEACSRTILRKMGSVSTGNT